MLRALTDLWNHSPALFCWVILLFTVNLAPLAWLYVEPSTLAWTGVILGVGPLLVNVGYLVAYRGMGNFMSVPHLIGWVPLHVYLAGQLAGDQLEGPVYWSVLAVVLVNSLSLPFDARDGWKWWQGERELLFRA